MDNIRASFRNPLIPLLVGLIVGLFFGLVVLGWWIWPVQWKDAGPGQLSQDWKTDFLRMTIASFAQNPDVVQAKERYAALGKGNDKLLNAVIQDPAGLDPVAIAQFAAAVGVSAPPAAGTPAVVAPGATPGTPAAETAPAGAVATPTPKPEKGGGSNLLLYLGLLCLLVLIIAGVAAYFLLFRKQYASSGPPTAATQAAEARRQVTMTDYAATGSQAPTAQFMASYKLGDDLFDDSFSIDSQGGEFLGECGVGISETIGVGDPKKVSAFEVWLFDKNDIQTVTKVLMSSHAYNDGAVRQRLEAKGETVLAAPGAEFILETQTLTMSARVVDMSYGEGAMPSESYFDHLLLELAIWQKTEA